VGKDGQVPDLGSMAGQGAVAFSLAKGAISGPINTGSAGVVLSVTDKQEPEPADISAHFDATRNQMLDQKRADVFEVYAGTLQDRYQKAGAIRMKKAAPASPFGGS